MSPGVAVPPDQAQIRRTHEARPGSLRRDVRVLDPRLHGRGHARRTGRVALRAAAALGDALRGAPDRDRCDRGSDAAHAAAQARRPGAGAPGSRHRAGECRHPPHAAAVALGAHRDRKSTRLNSSHSQISYAVFCLKKKNTKQLLTHMLTRVHRTPQAKAYHVSTYLSVSKTDPHYLPNTSPPRRPISSMHTTSSLAL